MELADHYTPANAKVAGRCHNKVLLARAFAALSFFPIFVRLALTMAKRPEIEQKHPTQAYVQSAGNAGVVSSKRSMAAALRSNLRRRKAGRGAVSQQMATLKEGKTAK